MDCVGRQTVKFNYNLLYLLTRHNKPDSRVCFRPTSSRQTSSMNSHCFSSRFSIRERKIARPLRGKLLLRRYIIFHISILPLWSLYIFVHLILTLRRAVPVLSSFSKKRRRRSRRESRHPDHYHGDTRWIHRDSKSVMVGFNAGYLDRRGATLRPSSPSFSLSYYVSVALFQLDDNRPDARGFALTCSCFDLLVNFPPSILFVPPLLFDLQNRSINLSSNFLPPRFFPPLARGSFSSMDIFASLFEIVLPSSLSRLPPSMFLRFSPSFETAISLPVSMLEYSQEPYKRGYWIPPFFLSDRFYDRSGEEVSVV